jgi:hypothetical protein
MKEKEIDKWRPFAEGAPLETRGKLGKGEGVYPPVAKESVRKRKKINGICSVPSEDDGGEGGASD